MPNKLWTTNDIVDEQYRNSLEYGMAVNTDRALPNAVDGLKPVAKRSLYDMWETGTSSTKPHKKSARVVGDTMGKFHPHGQDSIYGAIVRLTQPWVLRYPLIDGHGNFGNIGGDPPAAMRYSEVRLTKLAEDGLLSGLKKKNVDFGPNYDETEDEPISLPAIFPNLLCNPNEGIGWAMGCSWGCHSLREVADVIFHYMDGENLPLLYPDFPTGGTLLIKPGDIEAINSTGHGSVKIRANYEFDEQDIIFTEIPYGTRIESLMQEIGKASDEGTITGISDIRNESNKKGLRLVIEVEKGANLNSILKNLLLKTNLQTTFSYNQMALVNKTPTELNLRDCCKIYVDYNIECIIKEAEFDLKKATDRLHVLEGLLKALEDIDNIIALIKKSSSGKVAKDALIEKYSFTEEQAKAILAMRLSSLANLEKIELQNEQSDLIKTAEHLNALINDSDVQKNELKTRLQDIVNKYGDDRRTKIMQIENTPKEEKEIENVEPEKCVIISTVSGNIKRIPTTSFKTQKRNGKGVKTQDDITDTIIRTNTIDSLLIFSNKGNVYRLLVNDIPEGTNTSKGQPITSLIEMLPSEKPTVIYSAYRDTDAEYIFFVTKKGLAKKTSIKEYTSIKKKNGTAAIKLKEDDEIAAVALIKNESIILTTSGGNCIHFDSKEIAASGRVTQGMKAITMKDDEEVTGMVVVRESTDNLAVFMPNGVARQIPLKDFPKQKRAGKGIKIGEVADMTLVAPSDTLLVSGQKKNICIAANDIPILGRLAQGNQIIKGDRIISVSKI